MAKIKLGTIVGQISGSAGATTFAHGRFGAYIRLRSIPVQPDSTPQLQQRAALSHLASEWGTLNATKRLAWKVWGQNNPITDRLGDKRVLSGAMAYVQCNARLQRLALPTFDTPPVAPAPSALTSLSISASVATQNVTVSFAPSPIGANHMLSIFGCKTPTPTINYIKNLLRWLDAETVLGGTPYTLTNFAAKLGTLSLGECAIVWCYVLDGANGLQSTPIEARCTVAA
jgi:hypothetical protein